VAASNSKLATRGKVGTFLRGRKFDEKFSNDTCTKTQRPAQSTPNLSLSRQAGPLCLKFRHIPLTTANGRRLGPGNLADLLLHHCSPLSPATRAASSAPADASAALEGELWAASALRYRCQEEMMMIQQSGAGRAIIHRWRDIEGKNAHSCPLQEWPEGMLERCPRRDLSLEMRAARSFSRARRGYRQPRAAAKTCSSAWTIPR
jgi:hypothetical protein